MSENTFLHVVAHIQIGISCKVSDREANMFNNICLKDSADDSGQNLVEPLLRLLTNGNLQPLELIFVYWHVI